MEYNWFSILNYNEGNNNNEGNSTQEANNYSPIVITNSINRVINKGDKISFDVDKYAYEKELKKMNIEEFIDFCIRNQRYIIRSSKK